MTKQEAMEAIQNGEKVTHQYFSKEEYLYKRDDGAVVSEDGYKVTLDFWSYRTDPEWQINWSIFK
jgi:acyl-coenzyme A synthetase/AMP-(fatty) acid ligase